MATIKNAHLTGVTANLKDNEIKITLSVPIEDYDFEKAQKELEPYLDKEHNSVDVVITPKQLPLKGLEVEVKKFN